MTLIANEAQAKDSQFFIVCESYEGVSGSALSLYRMCQHNRTSLYHRSGMWPHQVARSRQSQAPMVTAFRSMLSLSFELHHLQLLAMKLSTFTKQHSLMYGVAVIVVLWSTSLLVIVVRIDNMKYLVIQGHGDNLEIVEMCERSWRMSC